MTDDLTTNVADRTPSYELGHSDRELQRLIAQARRFDPVTRQFFREAGIVPGMRVLDVGSGAGDVSFLAADLVGSTGQVIGTDKSQAALAMARERAAAGSLHRVTFREGDPADMAFERPFDAIVGRFVLMYYADPAATLRKLARHVRPGGVMVFHEPDYEGGVKSYPLSPTHDQCFRWIAEAFRMTGTETRMGVKLHAAFVAAGLPAPSMRLSAFVGGGTNTEDYLRAVADIVRTLLPAIERFGVATASEVDIETLAERMQREIALGGGVVIGLSHIGAWSRL
jgi:SAM-dependent methyltransferase